MTAAFPPCGAHRALENHVGCWRAHSFSDTFARLSAAPCTVTCGRTLRLALLLLVLVAMPCAGGAQASLQDFKRSVHERLRVERLPTALLPDDV